MRKTSVGMNIYASTLCVFLAMGNICQVFWTVLLTSEQIKTGWGYGTNLEIAVIVPILTSMLCVPVLLAGLIYFILHAFRRSGKGICIANIALYAALLLQSVLIYLFMWF